MAEQGDGRADGPNQRDEILVFPFYGVIGRIRAAAPMPTPVQRVDPEALRQQRH
jgi:hypothetical protein